MSEAAREEFRKKKPLDAVERNSLIKPDFDGTAKIIFENGEYFLELALDKSWLTEQKRNLVSSKSLNKAVIPDLQFENIDGSELVIDKDYFGELRDKSNPSPGPLRLSQAENKGSELYSSLKILKFL